MEEEQIIKKLLDDLEIASVKRAEKLVVIGFIGLPGSGKSTLAQVLSKKVGFPVLSNDQIRRYFDSIGIKDDTSKQALVLKIAGLRIQKLVQNGVSHIIDADLFAVVEYVNEMIEKYGGKLLLVAVDAPEELTKKRIDARLGDRSNYSNANFEKYLERKALYEKESRQFDIYMRVLNEDDTSLEKEADRLIKKLQAEGFLAREIKLRI